MKRDASIGSSSMPTDAVEQQGRDPDRCQDGLGVGPEVDPVERDGAARAGGERQQGRVPIDRPLGSLARDGPQVSSPQSGSRRRELPGPPPGGDIGDEIAQERLPMLAGLEAVVPRLEIAHRV